MNAGKSSSSPAATACPAAAIEQISRNEAGQVVVRLKGEAEPVVDAVVARCFPWTLPESYISIRDRKGKEMSLLKTLAELDPASREVIEEEIRDKIFNPKIRRILSHAREFGVTSITADTDRGEVTFQIRTRDDIRVLSPTHLLLRDADGSTYEVADLSRMDAASRRHLEQYL
jgi:hypothetical protein